MQKLRILLIDSSILASEKIAQGLLLRLPEGSLVEKCLSAVEAEKKAALFRPDVIAMNFAIAVFTLDGNPFLPLLIRKTALPIVAYGLLPSGKESALALGAADYVVKPEDSGDRAFLSRLAASARFAAKGGARKAKTPEVAPGSMLTRDLWRLTRQGAACTVPATLDAAMPKDFDPGQAPSIPRRYKRTKGPALIAIGSSTGGPDALSQILTKLAPPMPPIVIVQHIPATFSALFANRLDGECALHIKEAEDGEVLRPDTVYIAPGGKHMTLQRKGEELRLRCEKGPRVHNCCPSADVLFHSVAAVAGREAAGVILTGMGRDGAAGLLEMREKGAPTLGQDEASCVVYGMPRAAYEIGAVCRQIPLPQMANAITKLAHGK